MTDPRPDPELIALARSGDAAAFGTLWQRHQESAMRAAMALTSNRADAEDAVGETFQAVHRALLNGAGPEIHFRAYLLTALRHTVSRRQIQAHRVISTDDVPDIGVDDEENGGGEPSEKAIAIEAYDSLPERYRAVLWHAEVEGEPLAKVAQVVGLTPGAVAQLLVRARRQLRRAYLQSHIDHARRSGASTACRATQDDMGAYYTGSLASRDRDAVDRHLSECDGCRAMLVFAGDVGAGLRSCALPVLLGSAAAGRYLAPSGHGAKVVHLGARLKHHALSHPAVAAVAVAVVVAASVISGVHLAQTSHSSGRLASVTKALPGSPGARPPTLSAPAATGAGPAQPATLARPSPVAPAHPRPSSVGPSSGVSGVALISPTSSLDATVAARPTAIIRVAKAAVNAATSPTPSTTPTVASPSTTPATAPPVTSPAPHTRRHPVMAPPTTVPPTTAPRCQVMAPVIIICIS